MRQTTWSAVLGGILIALLAVACENDGGNGEGPPVAPDTVQGDVAAPPEDTAGDVPDAHAPPPTFVEPGCDDSHPPLVMAHGMLASGDTYANLTLRAASNGLCADRYHAFDWNTLDRTVDHVGALDALIDAVLDQHGVTQAHLIGHSAGGGLAYDYLAEPARAAKVARYVHVGSFVNEGPPGPEGAEVPTLNLYSAGDLIVEGADVPGVENVALVDEDHYAVVTSVPSYEAIHEFLYGAPPATTEIAAQPRPVLLGKAVQLGDNTPLSGARVEIWLVAPETGLRLGDEPEAAFVTAEDGAFGPFIAAAGDRYEMALFPVEGRTVRYYREPFVRSNGLVYLRGLPSGGFTDILFNQVRFDDAHTVLVNFTANRAVIAGQDSLTLDGDELALPEIAAAEDSLIALFLYDANGDGQDGGPVQIFALFPFLNALDRFIPADPAGSVVLSLNGRSLAVPRWPSGSEGAVLTVFE